MAEDYDYLLPPELEDPLKWLSELLKQQQKEREALIVHHTGGSTLDSALNALKGRGLTGYNWFVDTQGELIPNPLVAEGGFGQHMLPGQGVGAGLSNRNTFGISAIAPDESSVTPEQIAAIKAFSEVRGFDPQSVFGHGEVNPHKHPDEGMAIINAIRNADPLAATAAGAIGGEGWPAPTPPPAAIGTRKMGILEDLIAQLSGEQGSAAQASGGSLAAMLGLEQPAAPRQGGLDPEMMGYLAMIAKGLSPYSAIEPQQMLAQAQRQKETRELAAQRQAEQRQNLMLRLGESQRAQEAAIDQRREALAERTRAAQVAEQTRRDALVPSDLRTLEQINADRTTRGLQPYSTEEGLAAIAKMKAAGTTVNIDMAGRARDVEEAKTYTKQFFDYQEQGRTARNQLDTLGSAEALMNTPGFRSGTGGEYDLALRRGLIGLGANTAGIKNSAAAMEAFQGLGNKSVIDDLGSLGAAVSNTDRIYASGTTYSLEKTPEGNRKLIEMKRKLAERKIDAARLAREYKKEHGQLDAGFEDVLENFAKANPLFPQAEQQQQPTGGGGLGPGVYNWGGPGKYTPAQ